MWIVLTVPTMVLAVAIAVVPVAWGSVHFHRSEGREHPTVVHAAGNTPAAAGSETVEASFVVDCPLCQVAIDGSTEPRLVDAVHRHAWLAHGIPSARHILESAVPA